MSSPMRMIIIGRLATSVFLLVPYAIAGWGVSGRLLLPATAAVIFDVWTLVWLAFAVARPAESVDRLLAVTVVVDGVALAVLTASLAPRYDAVFAWYIAETTLFAVHMRSHRVWLVGAGFSVSYVVGHLSHLNVLLPVQFVFIAVNAVIIALVSTVVSYIVMGEERRRLEVESQRVQVVELYEKLERSVSELSAVTKATELIHSTLEVELIGPALLEILESVIRLPSASLYVIDKTKQETIFSASSADVGNMARKYSGLELAGAMPIGSADGALSCIELLDHNQMVVVLCAGDHAVDRFSSEDRTVLTAIASELVVAVENSGLYRLTKRLAITDELTDLFNYRFLQQRLDDELGRAERYNKRLSLLMLDLDDFKRVNDTYGHRVGDLVLSELGTLLKSTVREVDLVARYGGEEFSVVLPETDVSGAFIVAEKIREAISLHRFPDADGAHTVHITASIGLANFPVHAGDKESLLRAADDAVYHSKETDKDRVRAPRLSVRRVPGSSESSKGVAE